MIKWFVVCGTVIGELEEQISIQTNMFYGIKRISEYFVHDISKAVTFYSNFTDPHWEA